MANAFGLIHDPESDLYVLNDTVHAQLQKMNPNVTFQLGNTAFNDGNSTNIVLPYSAFDMQAKWPIFQSSFNFFPIRRAANETQYTIGRTLLQEAYLIVDYEHQNFSLSQAAWPDPLPSPQIEIIQPSGAANASTGDTSNKKPLGTGAIAGIAVGGAVVLVLIAVGIFIFFRRRRQHQHQLVPTEPSFPADHKPSVPNDISGGQNPAYPGSSFYGAERKDTPRGRQNPQELMGNEFGEMDGQGLTRSELPASKPGEILSGSQSNVYEMSSEGSGTWRSGQHSPMTGTWGSQPGMQGTLSPGHFTSRDSRNGSQNGSQHGSQSGVSPYGSNHESTTWSTQAATYSSQQSRPYELP